MHGAGNDFVLLDLRAQPFALDAGRVRDLSDRRCGVGFDQLLVLSAPRGDGAVVRFEVWNADGSSAEQCGNGVRCIGLYLQRQGEVGSVPFVIEGVAGPVRLHCLDDGQVRAGMGIARFEPRVIPLRLEPNADGFCLERDGQPVPFGAVSMGNPHAVIEVDDVTTAPVASLGAWLAAQDVFTEGCNVGFAEVVDRGHIRLRVLERGAGETRACGSGACAAASVLHRLGRVDQHVVVDQAGGRLIIEVDGATGSVDMTGPAAHVFEGTLT